MPVCGKRITREGRDGRPITPTLSYTCDIQIPEGQTAHEGPCASASDLPSVDRRKHWETTHRQDEALKRHQASGLGQTQSLPLSSASIMETGELEPQRKVGRHHPSEEVECPFCDERPLAKNLDRHVASHRVARTPEGRERQEMARNLANAIPQPPASLMEREHQPDPEPLVHPYFTLDPAMPDPDDIEPLPSLASIAAGEQPLWLAEAIMDHHIKELPEGNFAVLHRAWAVIREQLPR